MVTVIMARLFGVVIYSSALSACAVNGHSLLENSAPVKIMTAPSGAIAKSEYGDTCVTPCSLRLLMSRGGAITIAKEGYEDYAAHVGSRVSKAKAVVGATADAAYYLDDPSPAVVAVDFLESLFNSNANYKELDSYSIIVRLTPIDDAAPDDAVELTNVDDKGVILINPIVKSKNM